jgi:hypothetical protein
LALEGGLYTLLVEEEEHGVTWLLLYGLDAGWKINRVFQMELLEDYTNEAMPRMG